MYRVLTQTPKLVILCLGLLALGACRQGLETGLSSPSVTQNQSGPVRLGAQDQPAAQEKAAVRMELDRDKVERSIENYRTNKNAATGTYKYVGVDLNGDGQAEVLVYLQGKGWCARTGCTLAILSPVNNYSYEPVSTIRRVKKPIAIASARTAGWYDINIRTGLSDWPKSHKVVLKFNGNRYPGNAVLLTPLPGKTEVTGEEIFPPATPEELEQRQAYITED